VHFLVVIGTTFAITFLAELPDKSMFASFVLGTRYRPSWVWAGVAAAFLVHVVIAVTAGQLLALAPHRVVDSVVAALFLAGAAYLWWSSFRPEHEEAAGDTDAATDAAREPGAPDRFLRVAAASFVVIFLAEWGDITQVAIANLAARYDDPVLVLIGAVLGLWTVAAIAIGVGSKTLNVIPMAWVRRITGTILVGFGVYAAVTAITG
jgi:putative Ca2+/H+ antiporter (TMEM165/GDT1 family)